MPPQDAVPGGEPSVETSYAERLAYKAFCDRIEHNIAQARAASPDLGDATFDALASQYRADAEAIWRSMTPVLVGDARARRVRAAMERVLIDAMRPMRGLSPTSHEALRRGVVDAVLAALVIWET